MTWINLMLTVPVAMATTMQEPDNYAALIAPGGGMYVVVQAKGLALVDLMTTKTRMPAVLSVCKAGCKVIGGWDTAGRLSGAKWDAADLDGKPTEGSKITECDVPYDRDAYVDAAGTGNANISKSLCTGPRQPRGPVNANVSHNEQPPTMGNMIRSQQAGNEEP